MLTDFNCRPQGPVIPVPTDSPSEDLVLLPMVITNIDEEYGCVSALTPQGRWVRPEPVLSSEVVGEQLYYRYRQPFRCAVAPGVQEDRRPEDHAIMKRLPTPEDAPYGGKDQLATWMAAQCDASVNEAFAGERSVGLVHATPERVYLQRSTRNRVFVRLVFKDPSGQSYDWIVPDVVFSELTLLQLRGASDAEASADRLLTILKATKMFIAAALTKPNNRFPGVFRGCQPLVGGVHTFPDYRALFEAVR